MTIVTVVLTGIGVVLAFSQFNDEVSHEALAAKQTAAQEKQAVQQSEDNAPFLIPATPPAERGKVKTVALNTGQVKKRADRLYVAPRHPKEQLKARLVIPLQNGGSGIALLYGKPLFVSDCALANRLPKRLAGTPGTYVVRSGEADQFGFFQPDAVVHGRIKGGGWYSNRYGRWGVSHKKRIPRHHRTKGKFQTYKYEGSVNVMFWYSDGARSKLRWTCVQYGTAGVGNGGLQYEVTGQVFGQSGAPPR